METSKLNKVQSFGLFTSTDNNILLTLPLKTKVYMRYIVKMSHTRLSLTHVCLALVNIISDKY